MKKQKRVLMFANVSTEKVSSAEFKGIEKEQKRNLMFVKLSIEKGSSDDCHAIEKAKSNKRTEEMELA